MPEKTLKNGLRVTYGRRTKQEVEELYRAGACAPVLSVPSLALATAVMRAEHEPSEDRERNAGG
jgi:hypothetical protein